MTDPPLPADYARALGKIRSRRDSRQRSAFWIAVILIEAAAIIALFAIVT